MDIKDVIDAIKEPSLTAIKEEFLDLIKEAKKDNTDFIKYVGQQTSKALIYQAEGKITPEAVSLLFKKLKKMAQIEANNAEIALMSRIQKILYRLLDIAIDSIIKAIIPIA